MSNDRVLLDDPNISGELALAVELHAGLCPTSHHDQVTHAPCFGKYQRDAQMAAESLRKHGWVITKITVLDGRTDTL